MQLSANDQLGEHSTEKAIVTVAWAQSGMPSPSWSRDSEQRQRSRSDWNGFFVQPAAHRDFSHTQRARSLAVSLRPSSSKLAQAKFVCSRSKVSSTRSAEPHANSWGRIVERNSLGAEGLGPGLPGTESGVKLPGGRAPL